MVPAQKFKDVGFDKSMVGGYGQDDRACAYPALRSVLETDAPERTAVCLLTDKEEIRKHGKYRRTVHDAAGFPCKYHRVDGRIIFRPETPFMPLEIQDAFSRCECGRGSQL